MSKRTTRIAFLAALALMLAILMYGALAYLVAAKSELVMTRAEGRVSSGARHLQLAALKDALTATAADRAGLRALIVTEERLTEFLALVEDSARSQGLIATTRSVDITGPEGRFEELRVVLDARGSYEGLKGLVLLFETMPFHIDMENIALDRGEGGIWQGIFTFRVTKERIQ